MLVDQRTQHKFDPTHYKDQYAEKLTQLVDAAVHGKELVAVPADEPRQVLSLLDALKASVDQAASSDELAAVNGTARDVLAAQLSRPRGRRKAAVAKSVKEATRKTTKKSTSRKPRKKIA